MPVIDQRERPHATETTPSDQPGTRPNADRDRRTSYGAADHDTSEPFKEGQDRQDDDESGQQQDAPSPPMPWWRKLLLIVIGVAIAAAIVIGATLYYLAERHYENTDDAFVDGHMSQVAAQVSGKVLSLGFRDNQDVAAGQALVEIDPRDFQVRLVQARAQRSNVAAQVAQMQAQIALQHANIDQAIANEHASEADLAKAQKDLSRDRSVNAESIARQQVDDSASAQRSAAAKLDANRQAVMASRAQLEASRAQLQGSQAQLASADADVANAELQLSYTHVIAPISGQATKRSVDVGNYVSPGVALLTIVPREVWITANFKENQLGDMHVGQPVTIFIDQYPDLKFQGQIDSFQNGTGSAFSTLPAENATGNYVKVVQRVPVKITFDQHPSGAPADLRLSPGLSAEPRVKVR